MLSARKVQTLMVKEMSFTSTLCERLHFNLRSMMHVHDACVVYYTYHKTNSSSYSSIYIYHVSYTYKPTPE